MFVLCIEYLLEGEIEAISWVNLGWGQVDEGMGIWESGLGGLGSGGRLETGRRVRKKTSS